MRSPKTKAQGDKLPSTKAQGDKLPVKKGASETAVTKGGRSNGRSMQWKVEEREVSRHMQTSDGITDNPALKILQTSTGRLGHLTALRLDSVSKHYVIEVKNRKLPLWVIQAWNLIHQQGKDFNLSPLLVLTLTSEQEKGVYHTKPVKLSSLYCLTEERHDELLDIERNYYALLEKNEQSPN